MKEYIKPQIEIKSFTTKTATCSDGFSISGDITGNSVAWVSSWTSES